MTIAVDRFGFQVSHVLDRFIAEEALPGTGISEAHFWRGFTDFLTELTLAQGSIDRPRRLPARDWIYCS
jgi:hypothetical protein